jgi:hypothetical protein
LSQKKTISATMWATAIMENGEIPGKEQQKRETVNKE